VVNVARVTLNEWVNQKRMELTRLPRLEPRNITPSIRDFSSAVSTQRQQIAVIAEIARATPEEGILQPSLDVALLARRLDECGVSAVAVAADAIACNGSPADLKAASLAVSSPILCRDLILERHQLYRARLSDADAVLLTLAIASPPELRIFLELAASMHMAAPVEVQSANELDIAISLGARMIVIPAFGTDGLQLETPLALLAGIPRNVTSIVRGPFSRPEQLKPLHGLADAVWTAGPIGRAPNVEKWLKQFVDAAESGEAQHG
jgi:indole-3-glycerol phosphate synthase